MLLRETAEAYCEKHTEHRHAVNRMQSFVMLKQVVHMEPFGFKTPHHKGVRGSGCKGPRSFYLNRRWELVNSVPLRPFNA
jgi:hypothetical protein